MDDFGEGREGFKLFDEMGLNHVKRISDMKTSVVICGSLHVILS